MLPSFFVGHGPNTVQPISTVRVLPSVDATVQPYSPAMELDEWHDDDDDLGEDPLAALAARPDDSMPEFLGGAAPDEVAPVELFSIIYPHQKRKKKFELVRTSAGQLPQGTIQEKRQLGNPDPQYYVLTFVNGSPEWIWAVDLEEARQWSQEWSK